MDYKQFRHCLCERLNLGSAEVDALTQGVSAVIGRACSELTDVAVPTFGTFVATKHNEQEQTDLTTGKRMLLPPEITISFQTGAKLAKRLRNE